MRRSVILTLCIVLCLALSLGGTIAYLTDSDGDVNVMTLGRVKIRLEEHQRDGKGGLETYEDDRMLLPMVGDVTQKDGYGLPVHPNFHDKIVRVVSESSNADAYLRVWIGVPTALLDVAEGKDAVHLVWGEDVKLGGETNNRWVQGETASTTIEEIPYTMYCWNYGGILTSGDVTLPVLAGLYLDEMVDNEDGKYILRLNGEEHPLNVDLTEGLQIPVLAQAVQAAGFESSAQAFAAADMDDPTLFDKYLDLRSPAEQLTEQVKALLQQMADALKTKPQDWASYEVKLTSGTYEINGAAAEGMSAIASDAAMQPDEENQKEVQLIAEEGEKVLINLYAELAENIVIVNEGGDLTINGTE